MMTISTSLKEPWDPLLSYLRKSIRDDGLTYEENMEDLLCEWAVYSRPEDDPIREENRKRLSEIGDLTIVDEFLDSNWPSLKDGTWRLVPITLLY